MKHRYLWAPIALMFAVGSSAGMARPASRLVSLPVDTVLRVRLNDTIGSDRSRAGQPFLATVEDPSLPRGTRVHGVVLGATRATHGTPGKLGVDFRTLELPDGRRVPISGTPTGLDAKSVRTSANGRLVATPGSKSNTGKY